MKPLKVCIIGLKCFDHIAQKPVPQYLGGIETQLAVLAKGLQHQGCDVSLITYDHGQGNQEVFDGVKVLKSYSPSGGIRGVRWVGRARRLCQAMRSADSDIYLQMGAGDETGVTALGRRFPSKHLRRFVFCLACDADCRGPLGTGRFSWETALYRYGLRRAELVVAQTQTQQKELQHSLGIESRVIPMAVSGPAGSCDGTERRGNSILWVGRLTQEKRFEWLLEAARRRPELEFHVAGTPNQPSAYAAQLVSQAANLPNIHMHGRIPRPELNKLFQTCSLLCCTSTLEGFPTTFLEAWSCGLPVVTTFDPDGIVARHGLGRVASNLEELVSELGLEPQSPAYSRLARAVKAYYSENHSLEAVCLHFLRAFQTLALS